MWGWERYVVVQTKYRDLTVFTSTQITLNTNKDYSDFKNCASKAPDVLEQLNIQYSFNLVKRKEVLNDDEYS